ncbi:hypothetical protein [Paenibacillus algorifonticola]|uniref:hypothetical protein n=1 Tax=Paenibacillus algorifonticola TaxID=684063 RepID=UPI0009441A3B|nr:hypothetical protein [Paenibacillus algorifonticola]
MKPIDMSKASETELLTIIYHDSQARLSDIARAAEQNQQLRPDKQLHSRLQQQIKRVYPR